MSTRIDIDPRQSVTNGSRIALLCDACSKPIGPGARFVRMPSGVHDNGAVCEYTACYLCAAQIIGTL